MLIDASSCVIAKSCRSMLKHTCCRVETMGQNFSEMGHHSGADPAGAHTSFVGEGAPGTHVITLLGGLFLQYDVATISVQH